MHSVVPRTIAYGYVVLWHDSLYKSHYTNFTFHEPQGYKRETSHSLLTHAFSLKCIAEGTSHCTCVVQYTVQTLVWESTCKHAAVYRYTTNTAFYPYIMEKVAMYPQNDVYCHPYTHNVVCGNAIPIAKREIIVYSTWHKAPGMLVSHLVYGGKRATTKSVIVLSKQSFGMLLITQKMTIDICLKCWALRIVV